MRPKLLDLFCGAGGAAMGYHRAGFDVVGVDVKPQPRYPFEFHRADALTYPLDGFDAYHASPPCQAFTRARHLQGNSHPELVEPTRARLLGVSRPYVIENVVGAPLQNPIRLCGTMMGLQLSRDRLFEVNFDVGLVWPCACPRRRRAAGFPTIYGHASKRDGTTAERRAAMGIDWMNGNEMAEAIPPAMTEFVGQYLLRAVLLRAA